MRSPLVGIPGLEPGKAGPESAVLPLHHIPIGFRCKSTIFSGFPPTLSDFFYCRSDFFLQYNLNLLRNWNPCWQNLLSDCRGQYRQHELSKVPPCCHIHTGEQCSRGNGFGTIVWFCQTTMRTVCTKRNNGDCVFAAEDGYVQLLRYCPWVLYWSYLWRIFVGEDISRHSRFLSHYYK